jgi:hypothetical protein
MIRNQKSEEVLLKYLMITAAALEADECIFILTSGLE